MRITCDFSHICGPCVELWHAFACVGQNPGYSGPVQLELLWDSVIQDCCRMLAPYSGCKEGQGRSYYLSDLWGSSWPKFAALAADARQGHEPPHKGHNPNSCEPPMQVPTEISPWWG